MPRRPLAAFVFLILCTSAAPLVRAQQPTDDGRLLQEVAGVNSSLQRLVALLDILVGQQETDILLKRIEMKTSRLIPLETSLRSAKANLGDANAQFEQMSGMKDEWESGLREAVRDGKDQEAEELRRMIEQVAPAVTAQDTLRNELERRIRELEDEIAELQRDIDVLDERLAERLGD